MRVHPPAEGSGTHWARRRSGCGDGGGEINADRDKRLPLDGSPVRAVSQSTTSWHPDATWGAQQLRGEQCLVGNRRDLVVIAMHDQRGDIDRFQVLREVGFREGLDAVVVCLAPPIMPWRHQVSTTLCKVFAPGRLKL